MSCNICSSLVKPFAKSLVLNKYNVQYFQCTRCGFIQTEKPYWLEEAYSEVMTQSDLGLVARNLGVWRICRALIRVFFDSHGKFVDYGGGYGLFVRLMRDAGFDFYLYDLLSPNIFAKGFNINLQEANKQYELVTAFEVFEHLVDPLQEIEKMLTCSQNILFTTLLVPPDNPKPETWHYYGPEHGQHISFYTHKSLEIIAKTFNLNLYSYRQSIHLLSAKKLSSPVLFDIVAHYKIASLISVIYKLPSLTPSDYYNITGIRLPEVD